MAGDILPAGRMAATIPYRLSIGVTGHRNLPDDPALAEQVCRAVQRIRQIAPSSPHTPLCLAVLSPLAEGADRLVAHEVLKEPGAILEAPLPLPREDYMADFATEESRQEFACLLDQAKDIPVLPGAETREEAYELVGHYIVDRCDVLIALWDGQPSRGQGGTADIVARARERGVPLFWITTTAPYTLTEELGDGVALGAFHYLDAYNRALVDRLLLAQGVAQGERQAADLATQSERAGLGADFSRPYCEWMLPYFVRADVLAQRYQRLFYRFGDAIFYLGAAAVAVAAIAAVADRELGGFRALLPGIETVLMLLVLLILFFGRRLHLHERWISYRFLAERFRSGLFLALADAGCSRESVAENLYLEQPSEEWLRRAFDEVWNQRPTLVSAEPHLEGLKRLLAVTWIGDQLAYQHKTSHRHERRHRRLTTATVAIFSVTLLAALLDVFGVGTHEQVGGAEQAGVLAWSTTFGFLSIALPALAGALSAIGAQREYLRNSHRSSQMARQLEAIKRRMEAARDIVHVREIAQEAEAVMLQETRDWFTVMRFHDFELHV